MAKDPEFAKVRNLSVERDKNRLYDDLKNDKASVLYGRDSADVFIMCMSLGFKEGQKVPLKNHYRVVNINALSEEQEWMIKSLAIVDQSGLEVLKDTRKVLAIAEEYANAGVDLLHNRTYRGAGDYAKRLEEELQALASPTVSVPAQATSQNGPPNEETVLK